MDYSKVISDVVREMKPSAIRKYFDFSERKEKVITLGVGEPDFPTPKAFCDAAIESINNMETFYTSNWGSIELREAISDYMKDRFHLEYSPINEVLITVGTSEALDLSLRSLVNPGDEVIIPEPCYVSYEPNVRLVGGVPVYVETKSENKFKLMAADLEKVITPKTKILVLPYPSNPTGGIMTREELEPIAEVVKKHNIFVISDELYSELSYGIKHTSMATLPEMRERTYVINGFSKSFAMTGWRVGFVCGPSELLTQTVKIHQYTMLCAPIMAQKAATKALRDGIPEMEHMVSVYNERRKYLVERLNKMGLDCFEPEGAFYAFPSIKRTGMKSEEFADTLLDTKNVAVVPGTGFGPNGEGFIRICYAYSIEEITEALDRIEEFVKDLIKK